jgi:hypothetical protein
MIVVLDLNTGERGYVVGDSEFITIHSTIPPLFTHSRLFPLISGLPGVAVTGQLPLICHHRFSLSPRSPYVALQILVLRESRPSHSRAR